MSDFWTPAHHAVEHEDAETLARLLASGSDPDEVFSNMTLLTHAIDAEGDGALQSGQPLTVHTTAVLLAFGADPELADPDGRTPLDMATRYAHDLAVQLLRTRGLTLDRGHPDHWIVRIRRTGVPVGDVEVQS